jgi:hypothetical protein
MHTYEELMACDKFTLVEYIKDLETELEGLSTRIGPLIMSKESYDRVEVVFPDNVYKPFEEIIGKAVWEMQNLLQLREAAAVSGAMRWSWSQEAGIVSDNPSVKKFRYV